MPLLVSSFIGIAPGNTGAILLDTLRYTRYLPLQSAYSGTPVGLLVAWRWREPCGYYRVALCSWYSSTLRPLPGGRLFLLDPLLCWAYSRATRAKPHNTDEEDTMSQTIEKFTPTETRENQATKLNRLLEYIAALEARLAALEELAELEEPVEG